VTKAESRRTYITGSTQNVSSNRHRSAHICAGYAELDGLVLAYATTIHKSQGLEYTAVVIPFSIQHYPMLQQSQPASRGCCEMTMA
jgi:hypothetical protein